MAKRLLVLFLFAVGCVGGQSREAKQESNVARAEAPGPTPLTHPERDWRKAATGHDAVGPIPADVLQRMERESAPGGTLSPDAGVKSPSAS